MKDQIEVSEVMNAANDYANNAYPDLPGGKYAAYCGYLRGYNSREDEIKAKDAEIANLKTVMIAAAEEIQAHWEAHCDEEGYGPANLMHRLEKGIPSEYGYKAGAFAAQDARIQQLEGAMRVIKGIVYAPELPQEIAVWQTANEALNPKP